MSRMRLVAVLFAVFFAMTANVGCAYNEAYEKFGGEKTELSRRPLSEPRTGQAGECVRDFEVVYEEKGVAAERTKRRTPNYTAGGIFGAVGLTLMLGFPYDPGAVLIGLASLATSVVWLTHTIVVDVSSADPTTITRRVEETETVASKGCGTSTTVAAGSCLTPDAASEKIAKLDAVLADGLMSQDDYDGARAKVDAQRCSSSGGADPRQELRELKKLHDEGLLTDEEYEKKRKELVDQL